jgi:hypothetical protein
MGCCKCEKHDWEDPQPVVCSVKGKDYCVFHAPKDKKFKKLGSEEMHTAEEYNALVFRRVDETIRAIGTTTSVSCDFSGVVFPYDISFRKYDENYPIPTIHLNNAIFRGKVDFNGTTFCGESFFGDAIFFKEVDFTDAVFHRNVGMWRAIFSSVSFYRTRFFDEVDFQWAKFGFTQKCSVDSSLAHDRQRNNVADFTECKTINGNLLMHELTKRSIGNIIFTRIETPHLSFLGCRWPERLGLETHGKGDTKNLLACEELYRSMKQRAAEAHDQPQVSHWHYQEKRIALKRGGNGIFEAVMLWLYWATSGFGERALRAGCCLAGLTVLPLLLFSTAKLAATSVSFRPDYIAIAEVFTDWQRAMPLSKVPSGSLPSAWKLWTFYVSQLLIALQATLFGFALRNRFRR